MESFNSLLRGAIIGLLIITFVKVAHIERTVDAITKELEMGWRNERR